MQSYSAISISNTLPPHHPTQPHTYHSQNLSKNYCVIPSRRKQNFRPPDSLRSSHIDPLRALRSFYPTCRCFLEA